MPDIKWIKITTEMFDDEKIRIIESMPEADTLIVLWVRLICMAGKTNDNGYIYLMPEIPYTIEQLAAIFNRPLNTVKLAIETFTRLRMVTLSDDGIIFLPAFERHQNIEGMERVREANRKRVADFRARQKELTIIPTLQLPAPDALDTYARELQPQFPEIDCPAELVKFRLYWSEGNRKLKRPKLALLNWMNKAKEIKQDGPDRKDTKSGIPGNRPAGAFDDLEKGK